MSIKKILLLVCMALAATAFAAPSVAQASPKWFEHVEEEVLEVPEGHHRELHMTGPVGLTIAGSMLAVEPCETTFSGLAVNENGMAEGTVTNAEALEACKTKPPIPGCTASVTFPNLPWPVTGLTKLTGNRSGLEIRETTITYDFNAACQAAGVPAKISIAGAITPFSCVIGCFTLSGHKDDLVVEGSGMLADLTGHLTMGGEPLLTLLPEEEE